MVPAVEPVAETTVAPEGAEAPAATDATPTAAEVAKDETAAVPTDAVVAGACPAFAPARGGEVKSFQTEFPRLLAVLPAVCVNKWTRA